MKISANWLKEYVKLVPPFEKNADSLTMSGLEVKKMEEVGKDVVFEIEITSNRPDWLSHLGVARELAAVENLSLQIPKVDFNARRPVAPGWKINLRDQEASPYYTACLIEGIQWTPTPDFIKDRLTACGIRCINLIVDITNYILFETGHPLHAFDADRLKGAEIQVRPAKKDEKLTTINKQILTLTPDDLVVADKEVPIALAGIMGGLDSEVSEHTRSVLLESAYFHPAWIRASARRHQIHSESSYRFERKVDPQGVDYARERAIQLIQQYAKPRFVSAPVRAGEVPGAAAKTKIYLRLNEVEALLGANIKASEITSIFNRLGLDVKTEVSSGWSVGIPSFRSDLTRPVDLIEEIARVYGFDKIPEKLPSREPVTISRSKEPLIEEKARDFFVGTGFYETITFSLISEHGLENTPEFQSPLQLVNPQHDDLRLLRPTLLMSFLPVLQKNFRHGQKGLRFFEIANTYSKNETGKSLEKKVVACVMSGDFRAKNWSDSGRSFNFFDLKGEVEAFLIQTLGQSLHYEKINHPLLQEESSFAILSEGKKIGWLGEINATLLKKWDLDKPVYFAEISLEGLASSFTHKAIKDFSKFPPVERDLSVTVKDEVASGEIEQAIWETAGELLHKVELFDFFKGGRIPAGHKNLAYRLTYLSFEKTLLSEDVQALHTLIAQEITKKFGASFQ